MNNSTQKKRAIYSDDVIDLKELFQALWKRAWIIVLVAIIGAVISFVGTYYLVTPLYQSYFTAYVNNKDAAVADTSITTSSDVTAAKDLTNTYSDILSSKTLLRQAAEKFGNDAFTYADLRSAVSISVNTDTGIIRVVVTMDNPQTSFDAANAIAQVAPEYMSSIVEGSSMKIVDEPELQQWIYSPNYKKNISKGFLIGFALAVGIFVILKLMDTKVRDEKDLEDHYDLPILGTIPGGGGIGKSGSYYGYYGYGENQQKTKKKYRSRRRDSKNTSLILTASSPFMLKEAYNRLRTNIVFSLTGTESRCIGITSAEQGSGKSLTAINLSIAFGQNRRKTILIDCDMRRSTVAEKLGITNATGLSDVLAGECTISDVIKHLPEQDIYLLPAGSIPPNPTQLLDSPMMGTILNTVRSEFDYIILDLPPMITVADASILSRYLDGFLLLVRQNLTDHKMVAMMLEQINLLGTNILGFVYNDVDTSNKNYYKKYYKNYRR